MRRLSMCLTFALLVTMSSNAIVFADGPTAQPIDGPPGTLVFALTGQVLNSPSSVSPATSIQYGYLTFMRGNNGLFKYGAQDETTALFTFFTTTTTTTATTNGNLRTIMREGTTTMYFDPSANGNFGNPDTFKDGMVIQTSTLKQQVVVNTAAQTFTTRNVNTITATTPFSLMGTDYQLGTVGETFTTFLVGQLHSPPPPSGYFAGYVVTGTQLLLTACGNVGAYTMATSSAPGSLTVTLALSGNSVTYGIAAGTILTGATISTGATICLRATQNDAGQIISGRADITLSATPVPASGAYRHGYSGAAASGNRTE